MAVTPTAEMVAPATAGEIGRHEKYQRAWDRVAKSGSKRDGHLLALALLGWYLLLPPWVAPYRVNRNAPYSQWKSGASCNPFPSFEACANFKQATMNALKNGEVKGPAFTPAVLDWNYRVYWNGRCVQR